MPKEESVLGDMIAERAVVCCFCFVAARDIVCEVLRVDAWDFVVGVTLRIFVFVKDVPVRAFVALGTDDVLRVFSKVREIVFVVPVLEITLRCDFWVELRVLTRAGVAPLRDKLDVSRTAASTVPLQIVIPNINNIIFFIP